MQNDLLKLKSELAKCTLCSERFAATATAHSPRSVVWFDRGARVLIAGQAPGNKVHASGVPFTDPSGDRLRDWLGVDEETFYDRSQVAIVPMAFCFPGYTKNGSDLPPPPICAKTWRTGIVQALPGIKLTLLIGSYAQKWHLGADKAPTVTNTVKSWREFGPNVFPLPHPSWRNTAWIKRNPWFESDLLPVLKTTVKEALG